MAKRNSGEVGFGRLSVADGQGSYEYISNKLPDRKEPLEAYFGERFIAKFDELRLLGPDIGMAAKKQSDTSDLDCPVADYLELAEMTPLSEPWERETLETGFAHVYEFGLFKGNCCSSWAPTDKPLQRLPVGPSARRRTGLCAHISLASQRNSLVE